MKTILTILLSLVFVLGAFALNYKISTKKKPKVKNSTSSSRDNDDPSSIYAFCAKYDGIDTIYLQIDKSICGNYQLDSISTAIKNPYFHILPQTYPFQKLDTATLNTFIPSNSQSYFVPIYIKVDNMNSNKVIKDNLVLLIANMSLAQNTNSPIECMCKEISIYLYISENKCLNADTVLSVGECYKCTKNAQGKLEKPSYADFNLDSVGFVNNSISFANKSYYQQGDTLILNFGDGESDTLLHYQNTINHTYHNAMVYYPELIIKCKDNKGKCIYKAKKRLEITPPLILPKLEITYNIKNKSVEFEWQSTAINARYELRRRTDFVAEWEAIANTDGFQAIDSTLKYGQLYYYKVVCLDKEEKEIVDSDSIPIQIMPEESIMAFPNPTYDKIEINLRQEDTLEEKSNIVVLSDLSGKIFFQAEKIPNSIEMKNLPSGVYILRIGNKRERIIKL